MSQPSFVQPDAAVTPRFSGVATFMRTPPREVSSEIEIGLVGVPFDIGVNYRPGARHGPAGVREASRLIRRVHPTSGVKPFDDCRVADLGDAPVNPLSLENSVACQSAWKRDPVEKGATRLLQLAPPEHRRQPRLQRRQLPLPRQQRSRPGRNRHPTLPPSREGITSHLNAQL